MSRYSRHIILSEIGQTGQDSLGQAKVLVIGAGGLGCPVLQYLVAAGIGTVGIVDFDVVETSNLQRQILFGTSSLGKNKALAAKAKLEDLNPTISIKAYPIKLTSENAFVLFKDYDIIVDASDNFATRYIINDVSVVTNKPVVYAAIYKFEGQVSVFNYKNGPTYRCLFPNPPKANTISNCSEVGVLGVLPGIIGAMQANEVLKIILGFGDVLSGKLLCYNSKTTQISTLKIPKSEIELINLKTLNEDFQNQDENTSCENKIQVISAIDVLKMKQPYFIDVREQYESPKLIMPNLKQIPLSVLEQNINQINPHHTHIVICQSGVRSISAVQILQKHHIKNCFSLKGGVLENTDYLKINI